jgi:hypothetical protein
MTAIQHGQRRVADLLLSLGANPRELDDRRRNVLFYALV